MSNVINLGGSDISLPDYPSNPFQSFLIETQNLMNVYSINLKGAAYYHNRISNGDLEISKDEFNRAQVTVDQNNIARSIDNVVCYVEQILISLFYCSDDFVTKISNGKYNPNNSTDLASLSVKFLHWCKPQQWKRFDQLYLSAFGESFFETKYDKEELIRLSALRHIITHNRGFADERFIACHPDKNFTLNQFVIPMNTMQMLAFLLHAASAIDIRLHHKFNVGTIRRQFMPTANTIGF